MIIGATVILFIISAILFLGMFYFLLQYMSPGVYPPKHVLKRKAFAMAGAGTIFLLIGSMLSLFK